MATAEDVLPGTKVTAGPRGGTAGTLPTGGGTAVQNPLTEHAAQAGFATSAATGKVDGYQASAQVSGLAKGARVRFAVQVACIPAGTPPVYGPPAKARPM